MIVGVITFFMQVLTYLVVTLDEMKVYGNVSVLDVTTWVMITSILLLLVGGLIRHNGNS